MLSKFHGNILNLSENIAKSFRGGGLLFLTHTVYAAWSSANLISSSSDLPTTQWDHKTLHLLTILTSQARHQCKHCLLQTCVIREIWLDHIALWSHWCSSILKSFLFSLLDYS